MNTLTITKEPREGAKKRAPVQAGTLVKFGLDVHARQITVCRQLDGQRPQPAQRLSWARCERWISEHVAAGAQVHTCYEAGPCGYGLHRRLLQMGVTNLVVVPQIWDERRRRVKTDKRDAKELCDRLDRYQRGNLEAFAVVRVPTPVQEQRRALGRQRESVQKQRQRCELRGHGLMLAQEIEAPPRWWLPSSWAQLQTQLPPWLRDNLECWQAQAQTLFAQEGALAERIVAGYQGGPQPKGLGQLTAALLDAEICDWHRFTGRRGISSYTGLCPSEHSSGGSQHQGAVTKYGNPRVRRLLIEAAWRLLQWQPDYAPLRRLREAKGKRARKRAVVAVARQLAVDLWRVRTHRSSAEALGLVMQED